MDLRLPAAFEAELRRAAEAEGVSGSELATLLLYLGTAAATENADAPLADAARAALEQVVDGRPSASGALRRALVLALLQERLNGWTLERMPSPPSPGGEAALSERQESGPTTPPRIR